MAEEYDEDDDDDYDDDINAIDDDYDDDWYDDDDDEEQDDEDEDQVAHVDDEGWFHATEETINAVDEMLTQEDDEFAAILTTYTEARGALAKARIARGFYPVVVPADSGPQPRFGRTGGKKGKSKGKGKRERKERPPTITSPEEQGQAYLQSTLSTTSPMGKTRQTRQFIRIRESTCPNLFSLWQERPHKRKLHKRS